MKLYEIGPKIKTLRKEKAMTQEELSKLAGISRVTLGKLERGYMGTISLRTLDIILNALGYEIDFKSNYSESFGLPPLDELQ